MNDIAFILIVFFLVCASVEPEDGRSQVIPRSEKNEESQTSQSTEVGLTPATVTIDGTPANGYLWDVNQNTSYAPDHISDRGGPDPIKIQLTAGQHTIDIHGREPDTRLDTITLETTP